MYKYNTDSHIIQHIFHNLLSQITTKYQFTDEELSILIEAKKIMLKKAKEIDEKEPSQN